MLQFKNSWTPINSFKQIEHTAEKNNSKLTPIAKNKKFLPIQIASLATTPKCWVQELCLSKLLNT